MATSLQNIYIPVSSDGKIFPCPCTPDNEHITTITYNSDDIFILTAVNK